ncbi:MBL fold metallo-hydrolase [Zafaria sp. Z1313]|uniref:MBL fold metallo-hydrolase n=1 Tax=unclassified Zafaria TaxID=2828765 RepID=UPI002E7A2EFE|nr:MBL fold metallo-hydrolase [Zafaria sp. J156]MEE1622510.1 MBL fold metallo-hydrolase [Zafaria sp. J156]
MQPEITVLTAPNPGPMTLDGTNSYILRAPGSGSTVVVDPGPDEAGHLAALAAAGRVELVLITHRHPDHTAGIDAFHALTGAPVRAALDGFCRDAGPLADGEVLRAGGLALQVVATPGHTSDSLCFFAADDGPGSMLTGDTVLGRGTTILDFPDGTLADYLASLDVLDGFAEAALLPAHGPAHPALGPVVAAYREHRLERLEQVRAAVASLQAAGGPAAPGVAEVADVVYADIDPSVRGAAEHSVAAQLAYLFGDR